MQQLVLVTPDGKTVTINLSEWNGGKLSVQQMALVKQFQMAPPAGIDAASAGAAGYTLNVYNYAPSRGPCRFFEKVGCFGHVTVWPEAAPAIRQLRCPSSHSRRSERMPKQ